MQRLSFSELISGISGIAVTCLRTVLLYSTSAGSAAIARKIWLVSCVINCVGKGICRHDCDFTGDPELVVLVETPFENESSLLDDRVATPDKLMELVSPPKLLSDDDESSIAIPFGSLKSLRRLNEDSPKLICFRVSLFDERF